MSRQDTELNQDEIETNSYKDDYAIVPNVLADIKAPAWAKLLWFTIKTDDASYHPNRNVFMERMGIGSAHTFKKAKDFLVKHRMAYVSKVSGKGNQKPKELITLLPPSKWCGLEVINKRSAKYQKIFDENSSAENAPEPSAENAPEPSAENAPVKRKEKRKENNHIRTPIIDILNREQFLDSKAFFDSLSDQERKKVLMSFDIDVRYDFDSMSQDDLTALMQQVLKEDEFNIPHVLNNELNKKKSKGSENKVPLSRLPAPSKQPLGRSIEGIRGLRSLLGSKLKKGGIPFDGWEEKESAMNEFEALYRQNGEHVLNWIDAAISYNEGKKFKKDKITMADMFNDPTSTFETYMKGLK